MNTPHIIYQKAHKYFAALGINSIYPWKSKYLLESRLLNGKGNLGSTAPTEGGKSLAADILMLKQIVDSLQKKAILILPYVALVQENYAGCGELLMALLATPSKSSLLQHGAEGEMMILFSSWDFSPRGSKTRAEVYIAVCTIEKVSLLDPLVSNFDERTDKCSNKLIIEERTVSKLNVVVMDELHKGYLWK